MISTGAESKSEEADVCSSFGKMSMFVQDLDDSPAVLSLRKLCEESRFSIEWSEKKPPIEFRLPNQVSILDKKL